MSRDSAPQERMEASREAFLDRNWPTSEELSTKWGVPLESGTQFMSQLRRERKIFGVWSPRHNTYVHPTFQFRNQIADVQTAILPALPMLLAALECIGGFSDSDQDVKGGDPGRWRRLYWLYIPRAELCERSLVEADRQSQGGSALAALFSDHRSESGLDATPRVPADLFPDEPAAVIALARKDASDDDALL
jgi:hypothetical protein